MNIQTRKDFSKVFQSITEDEPDVLHLTPRADVSSEKVVAAAIAFAQQHPHALVSLRLTEDLNLMVSGRDTLDSAASKLSKIAKAAHEFNNAVNAAVQTFLDIPNDAGRKRMKAASPAFERRLSELVSAFDRGINEHVKEMPQDTYDQKKELADWVNSEVRRYGMVLKGPRTGHPSILVVTRGTDADTGRFAFDSVDEQGRHRTASSSESLPHLKLMPAHPARAADGTRPQRGR